MPLFAAYSTVLQGLVQVRQGDANEGLRQIQEGLTPLDAMEVRLTQSAFLTYQVEGYAELGQVEAGLSLVAQALGFVDKHDERFYEAELYRLKGELTLRAGEKAKWRNGEMAQIPDPNAQILEPKGEAEACFLKAIEVARKQQAKAWELRASTSLARLWQQYGKNAEAHRMLSEIYNWFTEGFDTADLKDAQALLAELA
jgi:tetratricopeptide (TPR) repeat protein